MSFDSKKVKILYLADDYAQTVAGVKVSLLNEMKQRGYKLDVDNVHSWQHNYIDGKKLLKKLRGGRYTHLWVAHTWATYAHCTLEDINKLGVEVLGFGFSDPYGWDPKRLKQYNYYATHSATIAKSVTGKPTVFFTTSCDLSFHKKMDLKKTSDVLFIGCGSHPWFSEADYRLRVVTELREEFDSVVIRGDNWGKVPVGSPVHGNNFLVEINKAKIGIDLEEIIAPIAHRTFEFPACGVPIITRRRREIESVLSPGVNMLTYETNDDLKDTIRELLTDKGSYDHWSNVMYENTINNHTIVQRVDHLLNWLEQQ